MMTKVLLVENDRMHAERIARVIGQIKPDWQCLVADSCRDGRKIFVASMPDAAVLKDGLRDGDAVQLLKDFKAVRPELPVIMMVPDNSESRLSKTWDNEVFALLPVQVPVGLLVMDLEMAMAAARSKLLELSRARQAAASTWKNPFALAALPANRAIALYQPFDIFSLVANRKQI